MKDQKTVGFIDLGTNSVRLLVVRIHPDGSHAVLTQQKEVIRLGEGEYPKNHLTAAAMNRAIEVLTHLVELAKSRGSEEFVAVATSATREAANGEDLCSRIENQTGVRIHIISGTEEARLIWLGVSSGVDLREEKALFIDIGGGSTEIIVGDQHEPVLLRSLKLGAIRTTGTSLPADETGPVSAKKIGELRRYICHEVVQLTKEIKKYSLSRAFGSSGTIQSLESVAGAYKPLAGRHKPGYLTTAELGQVIRYLAQLPLQVRRQVPGLNPERADIIIAGAVILHEVLRATGLAGIEISTRSLRDGLLVDYLSRIPRSPHPGKVPVRVRSVRQLGRSCHVDEDHAAHITSLSLQLYDSGVVQGLFPPSDETREILEHAAYLHDIGQFISFSDHHLHSWYLITHVSLLGFNQHEVLLIGLVTRYHRKHVPRARDIPFNELSRNDRRRVRILSMLLRIAEHLDRSHDRRVVHAAFLRSSDGIVLDLTCRSDCSLEIWSVESEKESFLRAFRKTLLVRCKNTAQAHSF